MHFIQQQLLSLISLAQWLTNVFVGILDELIIDMDIWILGYGYDIWISVSVKM